MKQKILRSLAARRRRLRMRLQRRNKIIAMFWYQKWRREDSEAMGGREGFSIFSDG